MYTAAPLCLELIQPLAELTLWITRRREEAAKSVYLGMLDIFFQPKCIKITMGKKTPNAVCLTLTSAVIFRPRPRSEHVTLWLLKGREKWSSPACVDKCDPCVSGVEDEMRTIGTDDQGFSSETELIRTALSFFCMFHACSWLLMPHCPG